MHPAGLPQVATWLLPFNAKRKTQRAAVPFKLPTKRPACFDTQREWEKYHTLAIISGSSSFNYCTDCTPEHRDQMKREGRCKFPGTTFVKVNGVLEGRRKK